MIQANDASFQNLHSRLAPWGQEHVLRWWDVLTPCEREQLARDVENIDVSDIVDLFRHNATDGGCPRDLSDVTPPSSVSPLPASSSERRREEEAVARGRDAIRAGLVAVVMVAGGQGSRLGHDGPKGTYPIGPVSAKSLFQIHAEKVLATNRRYGVAMPLYVMTNPDNHRTIRRFFAKNEYFGLDPRRVVFFQQGMLPAVDRRAGKLLLAERHRVAMSPNGHGGVLRVLANGGHLRDLDRQGIRYLFYFQVDNPLVKIADPAFLGRHIGSGAEMSLKVVRKRAPEEKLGLVVELDGRPQIIEYSDLPDDLARRRNADGGLELWAGSIAVHVFDLSFLKRLAANGTVLPYHRAVKTVPYLGEDGRRVSPAEPNAMKFETFLFDALPEAHKALVVETRREDEFEPLKNASGENSPTTVRQAMSNLFASWLAQRGIEVARRADGAGAIPLEISPLLALDPDELVVRLSWSGPVTEPLLLDARYPYVSVEDAVLAGENNRRAAHSAHGRMPVTSHVENDAVLHPEPALSDRSRELST
ncbi:MAG: UDPGP type 1 family protein [Pirellulales bacterium]|nr:UDPGP type 1 family protein [Pirellulales bacterium]